MAGIIDDMQDKFGGMDKDSMMARFEELKSKDNNGELDDKGRIELDQLKTRLDKD